MAYLLAALGGAAGALGRWGVATALPWTPGTWPWATLTVNLLGCFLMGVLLAVLAARRPGARWPRPFLGVGVLGGFTTFSAFSVEVVQAVEHRAVLLAAGYVVVSVVAVVFAVVVGTLVGRAPAR